jgi:signal transduction histidine kinase/DNA-binding CsgD family transcriptional regulator
MKTVRTLILLNALLFLGMALEMTIAPSAFVGDPYRLLSPRETGAWRLAGVILGGFGIVLLPLRDFTLLKESRGFALGLGIANALISIASLLPALLGNYSVMLIPGLGLGSLAVSAGLIFTVLRSGASGKIAEPFPISEEVRQIGEAAAQEERNRLARDLHDSIKQQIFSINVSTAAAQARWEDDPEGARIALADVRRSAREAMVEMQALLHQLQPRSLTAAGLVEALREQCEALGYRTGAEVRLELGESLPEDRLPPGALETFFRIAQEALANVARHARAHKVRVWISRDEESALLRVDDDGQGFDPATATPGMGLRNLRERAESLQGVLEVRSAPGSGTSVSVRVHLEPPPLPPPPFQRLLEELQGGLVFVFSAAAGFWIRRPVLKVNQDYMGLSFALLCLLLIPFAALGTQHRAESALAALPKLRGGPLIEELSEREKDVLRQLAHGRTNREIAQELGVSEETVKTHVGNILSKLQLSHRTQAVIYALKRGLVSLDDLEI